MAHLYILRLNDGTRYCGITNHVAKRIQDHQKGKSKSTKKKLPVTLIFLLQFADMKAARVLEKKIKMQGVSRWYLRHCR